MTEIERDPALKDFRNFVFKLWKELELPDPTECQYEIAQYLAKGPKRRMVMAFRGVGKSWLTAAYVLWRLYWNPNERILVVSASKDRSDAFAVFVKRLIDTVEWLQFLRPDPSKGQRDSVVAFDVGPSDPHQAPSVRSVGITGQMTGGRATLIVADDVETPKNSLTLLMRERLSELIKEFDAVLSPGGEIVYLGTPQCEESIYNLLPDRGYDIRVWPAQYPDKQWLDHYGHRLAHKVKYRLEHGATVGSTTDPARFSNEDLAERGRSYGRSGFALQFQLDTRLSDADRYPLKVSDFIVMESDLRLRAPLKVTWGSGPDQIIQVPSVGMKGDRWHRPLFSFKDDAPYTGSVMFIDPSGRGQDETSYAVVKILNSTLFLTASGGFTSGYDDTTLDTLARIAAEQEVNLVLVEPNFGDGMFLKLFQPWLLKHRKCSLEESERASVQKEKRIIDTLEPILNQHRLVVAESVVRADLTTDEPARQLFYQLTRVTREKGALKFDDRLDALAGAVAYWTEHLARSQDQAFKQATDKAQDAELKRFMAHVLNKPVKAPSRVGRGYAI
jgi:hypothetical protein